MLDQPQLAGIGVDRKHGDAVMAAVRSVQEPARRMNQDLGGRIVAREILGQRPDGLKLVQRASPCIVAESRDGR
jgi:hypothetical protein